MEKKVLLGITSYKHVSSYAYAHHMKMLVEFMKTGLLKTLQIECDMYVTQARNKICVNALNLYVAKEITHLLFVDDDMLIPLNALRMMIDLELPVVSGLYFTRDLRPVIYSFSPKFHIFDKLPVTDNWLINIEGAGAGCLLIDCSVLQKIWERYKDKCWFLNSIDVNDEGDPEYLGEDVFFFKRLKELGIPAFLDTRIQCGHLGLQISDIGLYKLNKDNQ